MLISLSVLSGDSMIIIILIALFVAVIVCTVFIVRNVLAWKSCLEKFKECNVIVFGKKGTGKDLLFQKVINARKDKYYSNISYGGNYSNIEVKDLTTGNTYESFIANQIKLSNKVPDREGHDIYLSDCGIILPSQYDSKLHSVFPSFSSYYALSRHLYNSNVHCNTQALSRVWKALREQADFYVMTKKSRSFLFCFMLTEVVTYEKYQSAELMLMPFKCPSGLNDRQAKEHYLEFTSLHGEIKHFYILQKKSNIKYDTRAYHKIIFGQSFVDWKLEQSKNEDYKKQ